MKILFLANSSKGLYNFRQELMKELCSPGSYLTDRAAEPCQVFVATPQGDCIEEMTALGCKHVLTPLERRGMNPLQEARLFGQYRRLIAQIKPDLVFSYTIKPNLYGGMACRSLGVPCVMNITGLGTAVENGGLTRKLMLVLYRLALPGAVRVFFQNRQNMRFFQDRKLVRGKEALLPGSGVNLQRYPLVAYPDEKTTEFVFVSRIMKEKGIDQYLEAAKAIHSRHPNTVFHVCGFCEPEYSGKLQEYVEGGIVNYHGVVQNMAAIYERVHCVVHPTYYPEGLSNVLLEACASGRPVITTDRSGCREVVDPGKNGFFVKQQDTQDLVCQLERFLQLPHDRKREMGLAGRRKVEQEFDRKIVVRKYIAEMERVAGREL